MSKIWLVIITASLIMTAIFAPSTIVGTMMEAAKMGVTMSIEFIGIYAVWMGFMQVMDDCKLSGKLAKGLYKPVQYIFGKTDEETAKNICLNIASNIIGIGSAATPYGIKAMQGLDKGDKKATRAMIMLVVINSTGIQLLPTTIIGLRESANSANSTDIILPILISSLLTCAFAVVLVFLFSKFKRKKKQ